MINIFVVSTIDTADIKSTESSNDELYFSCCRLGNIEKIKYYLSLPNININTRDKKGNTGIIISAGRGQTDTVKYLLSQGANVEDHTIGGLFDGKTALSWASSQGRVETVALLIKSGANPHKPPEKGTFQGKTAMMWAASQGRTDVVRLLLAAGVNVDFASQLGTFKGKSALMWASSQGRVETVKVLLESGANVNAVDNDGVSALMWASGSEVDDEDHRKGLLELATKGHIEVVQLLLQYGAQVDRRDKDGITAIMFASYNGHAGAVRVLLNAGANADYMNKDRKNAFLLARASAHADVIEVLKRGPTILNATIEELTLIPACGWLLSVIRSPIGTGIHVNRNYFDLNYQPEHSVERSCNELVSNGLGFSMFDLLVIISGENGEINKVINHLGINSYGAKVRAHMQLTSLYKRLKYLLDIKLSEIGLLVNNLDVCHP
eukprot:gene6666-9148_t